MWGYPTPRSVLMLRNPNCASAVQSKKVLRAEQTFLIAPHCEGTKKRRFHPRQEIWTAKPICLIRSQGDVHWHSPCTPSPSVCVGFWVVDGVRVFCLGRRFFASPLAPTGAAAPPDHLRASLVLRVHQLASVARQLRLVLLLVLSSPTFPTRWQFSSF